MHHNHLRDVIVNLNPNAYLGVKMEVGSRLTSPVCQTPSSGPGCLLGEFVYYIVFIYFMYIVQNNLKDYCY